MRDIHNHLLYGIDDGVAEIEVSVYIIKELSKKGYTDIIFTPHYIKETNYNSNNEEKEKRLKEIKSHLKDININLYLGNEVFITDDINNLLKAKEISSLANSKYILIELSLYNKLSNDKDILLELVRKGYTPVLAHPERYLYYQNNIEIFRELVNKGVLLQGNLFSLLDKKDKKKTLIKLIKENLIFCLSTDIHNKKDLNSIDKALKELNKIIPKEKQKELLDLNIEKIIRS